jgi:hypothetical protein
MHTDPTDKTLAIVKGASFRLGLDLARICADAAWKFGEARFGR